MQPPKLASYWCLERMHIQTAKEAYNQIESFIMSVLSLWGKSKKEKKLAMWEIFHYETALHFDSMSQLSHTDPD